MKKLLLAVLFVLAACTTTPQSPAQAVYAVHGTYAAALTLAVKYKQLPACPAKPVCSEASVVKRLQSADDTAYGALKAAQDAARLGGADISLLDKAKAAVGIFATLANSLGVQ